MPRNRLLITSQEDIAASRRLVMEWMGIMTFRPMDRTRFVTAASEIARNTLIHGGGGTLYIAEVHEAKKRGLQLRFEDSGPGIESIERALTPGYTTGSGMGHGLSGAKNLSHSLSIDSSHGNGCRVTLIRWM